MYRVNPFTYLVSGLLSASLGDAPMHCAANEFLAFSPPANRTCGEYMEDYMALAGGYLLDSARAAMSNASIVVLITRANT